MANRHKAKEEERLEKTIRGLLRYPGNRRCINCNSLGPQYVCTTFLTFVCTNCSGVHREFTHRVKSISMAKFNAEEVNALQAGGNERARQIYFKEWDPQRNTYPDGSNLHKLRDFIKHVYLDRKYTGDKRIDKLPKLRLVSSSLLLSPRSEDRFKWHHHKRSSIGGRSEDGGFKYYYDERRSPRYARENSKQGGLTRTPTRFEVVDDRFREDERGSRRFSNAESKLTITLPSLKKTVDGARSPVVRPVGDILGDKAPPLKVGVISKQIDGKDANGSANNQNIVSSSDQGSVGRNSAEHKSGNSGSLIDLIADSAPIDAATEPQTQLVPHTDNGGNFISPIREKASQASSSNSLESLLFELSVPSDTLARNNMSEGPRSVDASTAASTNNMLAQPSDGGLPQAAPSGNSGSNINILDKEQLPNMQQYRPTASPVVGSGSVTQLTSPPVGALNNQPWISPTLPNRQGSLSSSTEQSSESVLNLEQDTSSGFGSKPLPVETKSAGRAELPADLFATSYSTVPAPVSSWQNGSPYGMGFNMQYYPSPMPVPVFPNVARSRNPFDLNDERTQVQAPSFPTMVSLQGALPNLPAASDLVQTSSFGTQSQGLMAPQSPSYTSAMSPFSPSLTSAMPTVFLCHCRSQEIGSFGSNGGVFGSLNTTQQLTGKYSATSNPNPFSSVGGNPFG
ncbi:hypothetical protein ACJW30_10G119600 [Castanea mollissima]